MYHEKLEQRIIGLFLLFLLLIGLLLARLLYIQVFAAGELRYQAFLQRTERLAVSFPRLDFADREGNLLTGRIKKYKVAVVPYLVEQDKIPAKFYSPALLQKIKEKRAPFFLAAAAVAEDKELLRDNRFPGFFLTEVKQRYADKMPAGHLLGYLNQTDNQGMYGLERVLDKRLKEKKAEYLLLTADGRRNLIAGLGVRQQGGRTGKENKIDLTLDTCWQNSAEKVLDKRVKRGAVVVLKPQTGEILAMASRPSFNSNRVADYLTKKNGALLNRALTAYPPGSIFKIVTASAALEQKLTEPEEMFFCSGRMWLNQRSIACHKEKGHGLLSMRQGFAYSCNPVFIQLGLRLGEERIIDYALKFGLGQYSGLGLVEEEKGEITAGQKLYDGDIANLSIGQGSLAVTPLQAAVMLGTIVNDGKRVVPVILKGQKGETERVISAGTAREIQRMLEDVTRHGTGQKAYISSIGTAGKTGSAEAEQNKTHAWFVGYGPTKSKPEWVMAVLIENGGSGSTAAVPVFREIVEKYLADRHKASSEIIN